MGPVLNHVHISGLAALVLLLFFIVVIGTSRLVALKYRDHPLAQAWLQIV